MDMVREGEMKSWRQRIPKLVSFSSTKPMPWTCADLQKRQLLSLMSYIHKTYTIDKRWRVKGLSTTARYQSCNSKQLEGYFFCCSFSGERPQAAELSYSRTWPCRNPELRAAWRLGQVSKLLHLEREERAWVERQQKCKFCNDVCIDCILTINKQFCSLQSNAGLMSTSP